METISHHIDLAAILNGLAIACSLALILFLLVNRRKYGRLVLKAREGNSSAGFADQVSLHMMTQQSQKAYDNLQQSLAREFASLRLMGTGVDSKASDHDRLPQSIGNGGRERQRRYRLAEEMMNRGASANRISQHCGLMEGEVELLRGLQAFAKERRHASTAEPQTKAGM
jgi:hypothetical protein